MDDTKDQATVDAWIARLTAIVEAVAAMESDSERDAAIYYVVARFYGNRVGERVRSMLGN